MFRGLSSPSSCPRETRTRTTAASMIQMQRQTRETRSLEKREGMRESMARNMKECKWTKRLVWIRGHCRRHKPLTPDMIPMHTEGRTPDVTRRCPREAEARNAWPTLCSEGTTVRAERRKRDPRDPETETKDNNKSFRSPDSCPSSSSSCSLCPDVVVAAAVVVETRNNISCPS
jgi:hypothetical protein